MATHSFRFAEICEAYEVLSDQTRKAIYDKFGEDILKEGLENSKGGRDAKIEKLDKRGGYKFGGNSFEIFEKYFGSTNPFTEDFDGTYIHGYAVFDK
jgi:DnaJ-class molecular chaperone